MPGVTSCSHAGRVLWSVPMGASVVSLANELTFSVKGEEASPTAVGLSDDLIKRVVRRGSRYAAELLPIKQAAVKARGVAVDWTSYRVRAVGCTSASESLAPGHSLVSRASAGNRSHWRNDPRNPGS